MADLDLEPCPHEDTSVVSHQDYDPTLWCNDCGEDIDRAPSEQQIYDAGMAAEARALEAAYGY